MRPDIAKRDSTFREFDEDSTKLVEDFVGIRPLIIIFPFISNAGNSLQAHTTLVQSRPALRVVLKYAYQREKTRKTVRVCALQRLRR